MVTEAALRTGMLGQLTAVGPREALARAVPWERLLLLAYAYGTNTGISAVAAGEHGHTEADLRYTARRHFTIDGARAVAIQLANDPDDPRHPRRTRMGRLLTPEDLRGLTPLFWAHVLPYGEVKLNMTRRLALNAAQTAETNAESS